MTAVPSPRQKDDGYLTLRMLTHLAAFEILTIHCSLIKEAVGQLFNGLNHECQDPRGGCFLGAIQLLRASFHIQSFRF